MRVFVLPVLLALGACAMVGAHPGDGPGSVAQQIIASVTAMCALSPLARVVAAREIAKSERVQAIVALCDEMLAPQPIVEVQP